MKSACILILAAAVTINSPVWAQESAASPIEQTSEVNPDVGVPVFPYDITDRPYEVIGEVKAEVRKGTIFSKEASQAKIYRELWERGRKLKADAVIKASYGDARVTLMSWGSIKATGTAIRFKQPQPASTATPAATAEPAPVEQTSSQ